MIEKDEFLHFFAFKSIIIAFGRVHKLFIHSFLARDALVDKYFECNSVPCDTSIEKAIEEKKVVLHRMLSTISRERKKKLTQLYKTCLSMVVLTEMKQSTDICRVQMRNM